MLIFLLFIVLLAVKLFVLGTVHYFGPIGAILIIIACIAIAYRCEAGTPGASNIGNRLD